jgi:uncharacterized protein
MNAAHPAPRPLEMNDPKGSQSFNSLISMPGTAMSQAMLKDNPSKHRFELIAEDKVVGFADYRPTGNAVTLLHTEIEDGHEGKGYGSVLARQVLDEMRSRNSQVIPVCPFMAGYIRKHPEYLDLVDPKNQGSLQSGA